MNEVIMIFAEVFAVAAGAGLGIGLPVVFIAFVLNKLKLLS